MRAENGGTRFVGRRLVQMGDDVARDRRAGRKAVRGQRSFGNAEPVQDRQCVVGHGRWSGLRHQHWTIPGLYARHPYSPEPGRGTATMQPRWRSILRPGANAIPGPRTRKRSSAVAHVAANSSDPAHLAPVKVGVGVSDTGRREFVHAGRAGALLRPTIAGWNRTAALIGQAHLRGSQIRRAKAW